MCTPKSWIEAEDASKSRAPASIKDFVNKSFDTETCRSRIGPYSLLQKPSALRRSEADACRDDGG